MPESGKAAWRQCLWLVALLAPGALLVWRLCFFWKVDPQYAYGWSVPALVLALGALRWADRPGTHPPRSARATGALLLLALLLWPCLLVQEAAPDWSVANWSLAFCAVALTLALLGSTGGADWVRWFFFPAAFLLTAVPWPQRPELWLTQFLMRRVAACTVELLGWLGVPAMCTGNLIQLPVGVVGIDEACSGIRSLQSMLMVSLFLGELYRFTKGRRAALVAAGLILAFTGNVIRTTLLSLVAMRQGMMALERWHDPAGFSILCFGLAGIWVLALTVFRPAPARRGPRAWFPLPAPPALAPGLLLLCLLGGVGAVELWYRSHETGAPRRELAVAWPQGAVATTVPVSARHILLCSSAEGVAWKNGKSDWAGYHLIWTPGHTSPQSARMHRPETCMEASGAVLLQEFEPESVTVDGLALPCREYLFQQCGHPLYVIFALFEQAPADRDSPALRQDWSGWSRVQRALAGERNLGQESIELGVAAPPDAPDPRAELRTELARLVSVRMAPH